MNSALICKRIISHFIYKPWAHLKFILLKLLMRDRFVHIKNYNWLVCSMCSTYIDYVLYLAFVRLVPLEQVSLTIFFLSNLKLLLPSQSSDVSSGNDVSHTACLPRYFCGSLKIVGRS